MTRRGGLRAIGHTTPSEVRTPEAARPTTSTRRSSPTIPTANGAVFLSAILGPAAGQWTVFLAPRAVTLAGDQNRKLVEIVRMLLTAAEASQ
jgi:hypothetical protein